MSEMIQRVAGLHGAIGASLDKFGGVLRCEYCGHRRDMAEGDAGYYTARGWPSHCGYSMRWWTQRQINDGEMPEQPMGK